MALGGQVHEGVRLVAFEDGGHGAGVSKTAATAAASQMSACSKAYPGSPATEATFSRLAE